MPKLQTLKEKTLLLLIKMHLRVVLNTKVKQTNLATNSDLNTVSHPALNYEEE